MCVCKREREPFSPYRLEQTVSRTPTHRKFSVSLWIVCVSERERVSVCVRESKNLSPLVLTVSGGERKRETERQRVCMCIYLYVYFVHGRER